MSELEIRLPTPYPAQLELLKKTKRNNLLVLSRRWGKTVLASRLLMHAALTKDGYRAAFSAPTWKLMMETFERYRQDLAPAITRVSREDRRIELINKSVIEFWSSDDTQAGRGRRYHIWVSDESQRQRQLGKFIKGSVRPTLADFRGVLYVLATANGEGSELHEFYLECVNDPSWFIAHGSLDQNPFIHPDEIAQMRRDLGPELAAQELDSKWVRVDGVTPLVRGVVWDSLYEEKDCPPLTKKVLAVDASISSDSTAIVAVWRDMDQYYIDYNDIVMFQPDIVTGEIDYDMLERRLYDMWLTGKYSAIAYDPYQLVSIAQRLKSKGVSVVEFTQNSMRLKSDGFLRQLLNESRLHHPGHEVLTQHMRDATVKYTGTNFRIVKVQRSAKIDLAIATSMALWTLNSLLPIDTGLFQPVLTRKQLDLYKRQNASDLERLSPWKH